MLHCLLCATMSLVLTATPPDDAVARGRESLNERWSGFPWYDPATDSVRPVNVSEPSESEKQVHPRSEGAGDGPARSGRPHDWDWGWDLPDLGGFGQVMLVIGQVTVWLLVAAVLAAIVYLLIRAFLKSDRFRRAKREKPAKGNTDDKRRIEALPFPVLAARSDFLAEARRFYEQGEYGEAVKYLFSYELVQLDKHRVVRLTRGKTNRQYLRETSRRGRTGLVGLLEQTMLAFEDFFFGNHPIDRARFEACWSRLGEFESQLKGQTA
jgi:hypothetical protein